MPYETCCGPYLDGGLFPETAEQLMRSRYCAFVFAREDYLLETWHVSTRPTSLNLNHPTPIKWLTLNVKYSHGGGAQDRDGSVEFVARFKTAGKAQRLHENSCFIKEHGRWYYLAACRA